jgi:molecular chaperone Hsp33
VARFDREQVQAGVRAFRSLVGEEGRLTVTIEAAERDARYQGIVPLTGQSLEQSLEAYFASSEQIPTHVRLAANDSGSAGLLVQKLPADEARQLHETDAESVWTAAGAGVRSLESARLLITRIEPLLERTFTGHDLRLFPGAPVRFECRCSPERVSGVLRSLGQVEVRDILREQGSVAVTCEFCQRPYRFDAMDVETLFSAAPATGNPSSLH